MSRAAAAALALGLAACVGEPPAPTPLPAGDLGVFVAAAQPVLAARCAEPSCHGRADRPLALYAPGRRRADPARLFLAEPLDAAELEANARAVAAFAVEPLARGEGVDACLVLRKPLGRAAGGAAHAGGELFAGVDDPDYRALRAYLATLSPAGED